MKISQRGPKGFTLIELLIVITIIGILAVALVPRISQGPAKARDVARKADIGSISTALEFYFSDNGSYPSPSSGTTECISKAGGAANTAIASNMKGDIVPTDPTTNRVFPCTDPGYGYRLFSQTSYLVTALLETTTATGEGIYCKFEPTDTTNITALSFLVPCASTDNGDPHWYVMYK